MDLLKIDDQHRLSFREGTMNMLVLGGIGRGKTTNFIQPVTQALIAGGHAGLIVDVKNNFASKVRRMAAYYGREQDVIEIGNRETATPVNIIRGLQREEIKQILKPDTTNHKDPAWALGGWRQCCDVIDILHFTYNKTRAQEFDVSLSLLSYCINEIYIARGLYEYFKLMIYDSSDFEQFCLVERIDNELFHMLNAKNDDDNHYSRHVQWELITIRETLRGFSGDEKYIRNFSCPDSDFVLDFRKLLHEQKKIIVLRFDNNSSDVGKSLAALTKMKLYADIYRSDPENLPEGHFTFQVVDEFQDVFNPTGGMGDLAWFAKSREFNHINVISCQSLSSLYRGTGPSAVHELVTNCSCKSILQTEDVATTEYFQKYPMPKPLFSLSGSEAYFTKFDLKTRAMTTQLVDLTEQHARTAEFQDILSRLVLTEPEQTSRTALKERVIRLRVLIGMPSPESDQEQNDTFDEEQTLGLNENEAERNSINPENDKTYSEKKQKLSEYQLARRKDVKRKMKTGWCQIRNPGGFLRMDRKAMKIQNRNIRRESAKHLAKVKPSYQGDLNSLASIDGDSLNNTEPKEFLDIFPQEGTIQTDAEAKVASEHDFQSEVLAIQVMTETKRKQ